MTQPSLSEAASAQASQAGLASIVSSGMAALFAKLDVNDLKASLPAFTAAAKQLVDKYGAASGTLAARFYLQQRRKAGLASRFTVRPAAVPPLDQVKTSVDWATRRLWSPDPDLVKTRTDLEGMAEKLVLGVGRETVISSVRSDRRAKAWARVPEPGCCSFCALLAIRGAVYKKDTVGTNVRGPRNARSGVAFEGSGEFKVHDHCRCHVEPVFFEYEASAEIRGWQQLYTESTAGKSNAAARNAFRQAFEGRTPN